MKKRNNSESRPVGIQRVTGTKEWAKRNVNCLSGCGHDCWYCYAKAISIRYKRKTPLTWKIEDNVGVKRIGGECCRVMFPTTHDITPQSLPVCIQQIRNILRAGHEILIVSKPHVECITAICDEFGDYRKKILFRFTIGSASNAVLKLWEPSAPTFEERINALKLAHGRGFQTSVSCEPMLDGNIEAVIKAVSPFVTNSIWLGKMNQVKARLTTNQAPAAVVRAAEQLAQEQSDERILALYKRLKTNQLIKWKDSIKKVVGLAEPPEIGLDI